MNHTTTETPDPLHASCPNAQIAIELPLATIEELDHLATLGHVSRQELLRQIISAALLSDTPHLPAGEDPLGRLAEHACLTHRRSRQLATGGGEQ